MAGYPVLFVISSSNMYRRNSDGTWTLISPSPVPTYNQLTYAVFAINESLVYVGANNLSTSGLIRWDGATWASEDMISGSSYQHNVRYAKNGMDIIYPIWRNYSGVSVPIIRRKVSGTWSTVVSSRDDLPHSSYHSYSDVIDNGDGTYTITLNSMSAGPVSYYIWRASGTTWEPITSIGVGWASCEIDQDPDTGVNYIWGFRDNKIEIWAGDFDTYTRIYQSDFYIPNLDGQKGRRSFIYNGNIIINYWTGTGKNDALLEVDLNSGDVISHKKFSNLHCDTTFCMAGNSCFYMYLTQSYNTSNVFIGKDGVGSFKNINIEKTRSASTSPYIWGSSFVQTNSFLSSGPASPYISLIKPIEWVIYGTTQHSITSITIDGENAVLSDVINSSLYYGSILFSNNNTIVSLYKRGDTFGSGATIFWNIQSTDGSTNINVNGSFLNEPEVIINTTDLVVGGPRKQFVGEDYPHLLVRKNDVWQSISTTSVMNNVSDEIRSAVIGLNNSVFIEYNWRSNSFSSLFYINNGVSSLSFTKLLADTEWNTSVINGLNILSDGSIYFIENYYDDGDGDKPKSQLWCATVIYDWSEKIGPIWENLNDYCFPRTMAVRENNKLFVMANPGIGGCCKYSDNLINWEIDTSITPFTYDTGENVYYTRPTLVSFNHFDGLFYLVYFSGAKTITIVKGEPGDWDFISSITLNELEMNSGAPWFGNTPIQFLSNGDIYFTLLTDKSTGGSFPTGGYRNFLIILDGGTWRYKIFYDSNWDNFYAGCAAISRSEVVIESHQEGLYVYDTNTDTTTFYTTYQAQPMNFGFMTSANRFLAEDQTYDFTNNEFPVEAGISLSTNISFDIFSYPGLKISSLQIYLNSTLISQGNIFYPPFDGPNSLTTQISVDGYDGYNILLDNSSSLSPSTVYDVNIYGLNEDDELLNFTYQFETIGSHTYIKNNFPISSGTQLDTNIGFDILSNTVLKSSTLKIYLDSILISEYETSYSPFNGPGFSLLPISADGYDGYTLFLDNIGQISAGTHNVSIYCDNNYGTTSYFTYQFFTITTPLLLEMGPFEITLDLTFSNDMFQNEELTNSANYTLSNGAYVRKVDILDIDQVRLWVEHFYGNSSFSLSVSNLTDSYGGIVLDQSISISPFYSSASISNYNGLIRTWRDDYFVTNDSQRIYLAGVKGIDVFSRRSNGFADKYWGQVFDDYGIDAMFVANFPNDVVFTDSQPPYLSYMNPSSGDIVSGDSHILFVIKDDGTAVDLTSITVYLNSVLVFNGGLNGGWGENFSGNIVFGYQTVGFDIWANWAGLLGETTDVEMRITASDLLGNVLNFIYSFEIINSSAGYGFIYFGIDAFGG